MLTVAMTPDELDSPQPQIEGGWAALRDGCWKRAWDCFERAIALAETPESIEGLGWAAWWLDDAETVLRCREQAYQLYRRQGQATAAARMATWLASDQIDFHGAAAVASGWLRRAHRLLDPIEPSPDHGWLAIHEGHLAQLGGETVKSTELARYAAELGRRFAVADLEMLGLALEGSNLVVGGQVAAGMRCLDEATATALEGDAEIPISGAWACCFLVSSCQRVGDYERASGWCDRIAEFADRFDSRYMLAFCGAGYGVIALWRGRWEEAEEHLKAAADDYAASRPPLSGGPVVALAELRRRQGRRKEATELLEAVASSPAAQLCRGRMALDRGNSPEAVALAKRVLRKIPEQHLLDRTPALALMSQALTACGDLEPAEVAVAGLREIERVGGTTSLRAAADLAEGRLAAAQDAHERARPLLEDAVDGFERCDGPFEAAQARIELAATLRAEGSGQAAEREAAAAADRLLQLGAPLEAERARRLCEESPAGSVPALASLTPRELEILQLIAESGLSNRQIAERLVVSEHTVHRHVSNLLRKLDVSSRSAAAATAVRHGLLEDSGPGLDPESK